ncbi:hypothetical protein Tco_0104140 [Tanacetum coccineum]
MSGEEPAPQMAPVESPQMISTVKLPMLKKGEYTLWSMRMEQYLTNTDYGLWQVIMNGDEPVQTTKDENGVETEVPPKTAQALLQRQKERKAKSILLLAIPDEYQLRFHTIKDAKSLWAAIKSRFGGNVESKKMQKNVLKQQFENFSVSDTEGLDKAYDRFQKLISQLEIHGAAVSNEDANQTSEVPAEATQLQTIDWSDPAMLRYHAFQNRPDSVAEVRKNIVMYLKNKKGYKQSYFKGMKYEEIRPIFEKVWDQTHTFVPMDLEDKEKDSEKKGSRKKSLARKRAGEKQSEESTKRQKIEDDVEKEELKAYLDLVPREEFAMEIESLATKYPIVDWKTHVLTENFMYYQIFRADGSFKNYKIFSEMLDDFDRQDVLDLHRLVKARYMTSSPEGYDLMLWGDLKILFEPDEEDEVWRNQHEYNLISWRLFDSCGIHILLMNNGIAIHMMIEKKYPLTQEMLSKMLSRKLEVDHENEMAFELLRFIRSQVQK